jgi:glucosamine-phosphate N-acetyltransferase
MCTILIQFYAITIYMENIERVRYLEPSDYHKGYITLLKRLSTVDAVENELQLFEQFVTSLNDKHIVVVIEEENEIVASGTCIIENKVIHGFSKVAHIEDIVVSEKHGGKGLGKSIIIYLTKFAENNGCYKTILDCANHNITFYEKCGYKLNCVQMAKYI